MGWSWHPSEWGCAQNVLWERRAGIQNNAKFTLMFALLTASSIPFNCSIQPRTQHPAPSADHVNPMQHSRFSVVLVIPAPFPFESSGSQRRKDGIQRLLRTSVFPHHTGGSSAPFLCSAGVSVPCWCIPTQRSYAASRCQRSTCGLHQWGLWARWVTE